MFNIENNGPYFEAALECMTDQEITTKMRGAMERLDGNVGNAHRTLLKCLVSEGANELRKRWFLDSIHRIM